MLKTIVTIMLELAIDFRKEVALSKVPLTHLT